MHGNAKHYLVSGRVQGVSYRASTQAKAQELGLTGWVRNLSDGRVELTACGSAEKLSVLELWQGPVAAEVTQVAISFATIEPSREFVVAETTHKITET